MGSLKTPQQRLFSYWNQLRDGAPAPLRNAIRPAEIRDILPQVFLLERLDDGRFYYRLAGTKLCQLSRRELRGQRPLSQFCDLDRRKMQLALAQVSDKGRIFLCETLARTQAGHSIGLEWLVMPLAREQSWSDDPQMSGPFTRLLGICVPDHEQDWIGEEPIQRQSILAARLMGPNRAATYFNDKVERTVSCKAPEATPIATLQGRIETQFGRRIPTKVTHPPIAGRVPNFNVVPMAAKQRRVQHLTVFDGGRNG